MLGFRFDFFIQLGTVKVKYFFLILEKNIYFQNSEGPRHFPQIEISKSLCHIAFNDTIIGLVKKKRQARKDNLGIKTRQKIFRDQNKTRGKVRRPRPCGT